MEIYHKETDGKLWDNFPQCFGLRRPLHVNIFLGSLGSQHWHEDAQGLMTPASLNKKHSKLETKNHPRVHESKQVSFLNFPMNSICQFFLPNAPFTAEWLLTHLQLSELTQPRIIEDVGDFTTCLRWSRVFSQRLTVKYEEPWRFK